MAMTMQQLITILQESSMDLSRELYQGGKPVMSVEILVAGPDGKGREIVFSTKATE